MKTEDDFGFSFESSTEIESASKDKVTGLYNMIMPLLNNLKANPEKDTIKWPNRKEKIDQFIVKMDNYLNNN